MITVTDRKYNKICQLHFGSIGELIAQDDLFEQDLDTGIGIYEFKVDKTHDSIANIVVGSYLFVPDDEITRCFEITRIEEDHDTKIINAEDAGLDLLGETVPPFKSEQTQKLEYYVSKFTFDSGWEIGINEVAETTRKLEFEQFETTTKRLRALAKAFDAELVYSVEMLHDKPHRKLINFYKKYNADKVIRLEYGTNVTKIKKTTNIENLATAIRSVGAEGITLVDYQYNDGRYLLGSDGVLYDTLENERWKRNNATSGGYIVANYESQAKTKERLLEESIKQLKKRAYPEVTYEVDLDLLGSNALIGQMAEISDSEFKPQIEISARVTSIKRSFSNKKIGSVKISNITSTEVLMNEKLQRLSKLVQERVFDSTAVPFVLDIKSTSGLVFQNGNIQTKLISTVSKLGTDMTNRFNFRWIRESKYGTNDHEWNKLHENATREIIITSNDIDREATFFCEALENNNVIARNSIIIKDFISNKHVGPTPPTNPSPGDLWTDTSQTGKEIPKIYSNGQWIPVISDNTANIEKFKKEWEASNREYADKFSKLMTEIDTVKESEKYTRDLTGRFGDLTKAYQKILEQEKVIEGLGERQKVLELTIEQSSAIIRAFNTFFDFSDDGLLIGKNGANMKMVLKNDRLEFLDGGKLTAYMSGQKMFIVSGAFWQSITIGNHIFEKFGDEFTIISYAGVLTN